MRIWQRNEFTFPNRARNTLRDLRDYRDGDLGDSNPQRSPASDRPVERNEQGRTCVQKVVAINNLVDRLPLRFMRQTELVLLPSGSSSKVQFRLFTPVSGAVPCNLASQFISKSLRFGFPNELLLNWHLVQDVLCLYKCTL
jgi:hypothetical protein